MQSVTRLISALAILGIAFIAMGANDCWGEPEDDDPVCVTAGCSSHLCVPEDQSGMISTCEYLAEYQCLGFSSCGNNGPDGACAWDQTPEYLDCLEEIQCSMMGYQKVDLADLEADMAGYDGAMVNVCAPLQVGPMMCTLMACSELNPCCNSCGASYRFDTLVEVAAEGWGCGGNECTQTCAPFDGDEVSEHRCYYGVFDKSPYGEHGTLRVQGYLDGCGG